ncbi:hypothetical protein F480_07660 [Bibersteinia trehalosi Y31]|uniref:Uncharacterized protein n=1 Tax=Bibersteinia trehalosi Y31 TaxID=1261658 RepID=A0A179CYQ0_BIBTR|nr:hypothetical protein [Bibersteinia trehalosi]OAQ14922.1 hypothetical protein F480_07660 [Bibersteinia trehalosi Y31]
MNFILKEITSLCKELKECAKANPKKVLFIIGVLIYTFWDVVLVEATMPFRCAKWKNTEKNIFISKEEWQKKYPKIDYTDKNDMWLMPYEIEEESSRYSKKLLHDGIEYELSAISKKYPNMVSYYYVDPSPIFRVNKHLYYDILSSKPIAKFNIVIGEYQMAMHGRGFGLVFCEQDGSYELENYIDSY